MSKESSSREATKCNCGGTFAFMVYHWPHCPLNPRNLTGSVKTSVEKRFTKSELAQIAQQGPTADYSIGKRRGKKVKID